MNKRITFLKRWREISLVLLLSQVSGCAWLPPSLDGFRTAMGLAPVQKSVQLTAPLEWQAPLPHQGQLANLSAWWQQFNDPLLLEMITAAQQVSPNIQAARTRIESAKNKQTSAMASLLPEVNLNASSSKGLESLFFPSAMISSVGLATNWELDIFGKNQAAEAGASARVKGAHADWHVARVTLAAEVAKQYTQFRSCEATLLINRSDLKSRQETLRLTRQMTTAGFQAPANLALAEASSAQAANVLSTQVARCEVLLKGLVELTALTESALRQRLQVGQAKLAQPKAFQITAIPGQVLAQRPDIMAAAYQLLAASADTAQMQADRYPRLSFSGKISLMHMELAPAPRGGTVWSIGPLAVSLPLFDGGVRSANVALAKAAYEEANVNFAAKLRTAIREVEEALVNLNSMAEREAQAQQAVNGFQQNFSAKNALYDVGLNSLFELEDARRSLTQAQQVLVDVKRDRVSAWISLYRALGGAWQADGKDLVNVPSIFSLNPNKAQR